MSEELLVRNCSPTLAGMKTGSLFGCNVETKEELNSALISWNKILCPKGLRVIPLQYKNNRALIYVYRPNSLKNDFTDEQAERILQEHGYEPENINMCIIKLIERLREGSEFPHEIGLFLGYPPADVCGFIQNKACDCKCVGCWKVYSDVEKAQKIFDKYKKCTDVYCKQWAMGKPIEKLTLAI